MISPLCGLEKEEELILKGLTSEYPLDISYLVTAVFRSINTHFN
jgi:hypothetical protein